MMAKVPVNLTIEEDTINRFKQAVEHVRLSASGVVEVFIGGCFLMNHQQEWNALLKLLGV